MQERCNNKRGRGGGGGGGRTIKNIFRGHFWRKSVFVFGWDRERLWVLVIKRYIWRLYIISLTCEKIMELYNCLIPQKHSHMIRAQNASLIVSMILQILIEIRNIRYCYITRFSPQCQMNLVFHISEDGSEMELRHCAS